MEHDMMMNEMKNKRTIEDLLAVRRTHKSYQVAREGDTYTCMNHQANTKTIKYPKNFIM